MAGPVPAMTFLDQERRRGRPGQARPWRRDWV